MQLTDVAEPSYGLLGRLFAFIVRMSSPIPWKLFEAEMGPGFSEDHPDIDTTRREPDQYYEDLQPCIPGVETDWEDVDMSASYDPV